MQCLFWGSTTHPMIAKHWDSRKRSVQKHLIISTEFSCVKYRSLTLHPTYDPARPKENYFLLDVQVQRNTNRN